MPSELSLARVAIKPPTSAARTATRAIVISHGQREPRLGTSSDEPGGSETSIAMQRSCVLSAHRAQCHWSPPALNAQFGARSVEPSPTRANSRAFFGFELHYRTYVR